MATSSLVPSATNSRYVDAPLERGSRVPGARPSGCTWCTSSAPQRRPVSDTESKSPMMMSGLRPMLEQRVGAAVDADQHRPVLADVRAQRGEVGAVVVPAHDDERVASGERRCAAAAASSGSNVSRASCWMYSSVFSAKRSSSAPMLRAGRFHRGLDRRPRRARCRGRAARRRARARRRSMRTTSPSCDVVHELGADVVDQRDARARRSGSGRRSGSDRRSTAPRSPPRRRRPR